MADKGVKSFPGKKSRLILGFALSFVFLITYIGCSMLYVSSNSDTLCTVFAEESHYNADQENLEDRDLLLLSQDGTISVLSFTENELLFNIDMQISDSIESAGIEIKEQVQDQQLQDEQSKAEEAENEGTWSSSPAVVSSSPSSNSVEANFINMINHLRSSQGLQTLIPSNILNSVARSRSQDMVNRGYFSHYTPEGKSIGVILQEAGVMYACSAENLSQSSPPSWGSPETIINLWMGSSSHKANLLNPHFGQLGIGVVDSGGRRVVTLVLMNR